MLRQDVPAWERKGVGVVTVQWEKNRGYEASAAITNPEFVIKEKLTLDIGLGGNKGPHIRIYGNWDADQSMPTDLENWTQVGFNPDRHSFYYERGTERQVIGGDKAFQIGNTVFVKNAVFGSGMVSVITYGLESERRVNEMRDAMKMRRVAERIATGEHAGEQFNPQLRQQFEGMMYQVMPNKVTVAEALDIVQKQGIEESMRIVLGPTTDYPPRMKYVLGFALMEHLNRTGKIEDAFMIGERIAELGTEAGQGVQAFALFGRVLDTPAVSYTHLTLPTKRKV